MSTRQSDSSARTPRPSGATAKTAAGFGAFLAVLWAVPALLGFVVGGTRSTADDVLLVEIVLAAVPFAVGAVAVSQVRHWGRWVLLVGFVLGLVHAFPVMIIVGAVFAVPVGFFAGISTLLLSIAGIVLTLRRSTARYLAPRTAAGIPVR